MVKATLRDFIKVLSLLVFIGLSPNAFSQCVTTPVVGDLIISTDQNLSGTFNVSGTFRVDAGVTVTVTPFSSNSCGELIINAANIEINGNINGDNAGFVGGTSGTGATTGVNTVYLTSCTDKDNCYTVQVFGGTSGASGSGPGAGSAGSDGGNGSGPKQECNTIDDTYGMVGGAGGAGGGAGASYAALGNAGGNGGAGSGTGSFNGMAGFSSCASVTAGSAGNGGAVGVAYGTDTGSDIDLGSGGAGAGGGGKSQSNGSNGAIGGAGGGKVVLNSTGNLIIAGNISVQGEDGGAGGAGGNGGITNDRCCSDGCNGCDENTYSAGAGGGAGAGAGSGGGILISADGDMNISGTLNAAGGSGGAGGGAGAASGQCTYSSFLCLCGCNDGIANAGNAGQQGGGGSGGRIKIFENPCRNNNVNPTIQISGGSGNSGFAGNGVYHFGPDGNITLLGGSVAVTDAKCFGDSNGVAIVTPNGGVAPYTYQWSPIGGTDSSASGLPSGSYDVVVMDAIGCDTLISVTVGQPNLLTASATVDSTVNCNGGADGVVTVVPVGGTAPYDYLWNDSNAQTTSTATGLAAGTYIVLVTDTNGCDTSATVVVGEPDSVLISVSVDNSVTCFGLSDGQASASASGGSGNYTYSWNDSNNQNTATANDLTAGVYTVTVEDGNGCQLTEDIAITEPDSLVASATMLEQVLCNGNSNGSAFVTTNGGTAPFTYLWSDPSGQAGDTLQGVPAGAYSVLVTDDNQCSDSAEVVITEPSPLITSIAVDSDVNCFGGSDGSATATPSGGTAPYTYSWNDPNSQSSQTVVGLSQGVYEVTVTDDNGCITTQDVLIAEPSPLVLPISSIDVTCNGGADGSAAVVPSGGAFPYTYLWNDPSSQTTSTASGLEAGPYQVLVTDDNGCDSVLSVIVNEPTQVVATIVASQDANCNAGSDGFATVNGAGGIGPYQYLWTPSGQTSMTADSLSAGQYVVLITDANGCADMDTIIISQPPNPLVASFTVDPDTGLQPLEVAFTNNSVGASSYEWWFGDGEFSMEDNPVYTYEDSGLIEIMLVVYDSITGCTDTVTTTIYIEPTSIMEIPNVFTPDGDGYNDVFDPKSRNLIDVDGEVYNRWGEKVYEWFTPLGGWDGRTLAGKEAPAGVYYYLLKAEGVDGLKYEFNGSLTLIR